jgi:colicin import membrane protein
MEHFKLVTLVLAVLSTVHGAPAGKQNALAGVAQNAAIQQALAQAAVLNGRQQNVGLLSNVDKVKAREAKKAQKATAKAAKQAVKAAQKAASKSRQVNSNPGFSGSVNSAAVAAANNVRVLNAIQAAQGQKASVLNGGAADRASKRQAKKAAKAAQKAQKQAAKAATKAASKSNHGGVNSAATTQRQANAIRVLSSLTESTSGNGVVAAPGAKVLGGKKARASAKKARSHAKKNAKKAKKQAKKNVKRSPGKSAAAKVATLSSRAGGANRKGAARKSKNAKASKRGHN